MQPVGGTYERGLHSGQWLAIQPAAGDHACILGNVARGSFLTVQQASWRALPGAGGDFGGLPRAHGGLPRAHGRLRDALKGVARSLKGA